MIVSTKPGAESTESQLTLKSKRDQYSVEIRKKKTEDVLNSRRLKFARTSADEEFQEKINMMQRKEVLPIAHCLYLTPDLACGTIQEARG